MDKTILISKFDSSINFVKPTVDRNGFFESRFVQRDPSYFIIYVSSHSGCNQSCRFCHLTALGQTSMEVADWSAIVEQVKEVCLHPIVRKRIAETKPTRVHVNFMARGEPLLNPILFGPFYETLAGRIKGLAGIEDIRFNVSSIIPASLRVPLVRLLDYPTATLYYSLYSLNPSFRKRWLPKAADPKDALRAIADYQQKTDKEIVIHGAFIKNENDSREDIETLKRLPQDYGIKARFNLVRYNPLTPTQGEESPYIESILAEIADAWGSPESRIVPRVGPDVYASCGMFYSENL